METMRKRSIIKLGMNLMFFQELIVENENRESKTLLIVVCILFVNRTQVGDDEFGYMLADILKENNVNNKGLGFDPGARTALAFVTLRDDGEREFMFFRNPSADMLLQESELDLDIITKAKIFHYGSISLITEPCKSAHIAAKKLQKRLECFCPMIPILGFHYGHLQKVPEKES
ncbi:hypothetical protein IFM89_023401 [Coptis chinensis]|uniref:Carbohydrate kinase PfkB domain-containing protein n=1 Tax=Coptis chinensis TaxID=261450 RepID=A0A835IX87_9MAGN|nr:hypothetical protein IFM89_023401 [Coptis chinensis]